MIPHWLADILLGLVCLVAGFVFCVWLMIKTMWGYRCNACGSTFTSSRNELMRIYCEKCYSNDVSRT